MGLASAPHAAVVALLCAAAANAQTDSSRSVPWVTKRDVTAVGVAIAATLAIAPFDHAISRELGDPESLRNRGLNRAADNIAFLGGSGPFLVSGLVYAAGSESHMQGLAHAALHNMEAIALASSITGLAKGLTGRALPNVEARHQFSFGRGFHEGNGPFVSFPSGHTAAAFAMAATIAGEVDHVDPRIGRIAGPIAYSAAAAVGVARVIQRVHWPSDLPLAVVIGTWSGRAVEKHAYRKGRAAAALRGLSVVPAAGGRTTIAWSSLASRYEPSVP
ncbi:MAG: phosphoesterase PA-phosphatase related protein [Gemmatimonadetes bacterium]|nr:phosphoesterase PA-phosphatase related protein [Gemmatimonadota bacterium]